jgi:hypothetical protein
MLEKSESAYSCFSSYGFQNVLMRWRSLEHGLQSIQRALTIFRPLVQTTRVRIKVYRKSAKLDELEMER